jgi:hypothetical protein
MDRNSKTAEEIDKEKVLIPDPVGEDGGNAVAAPICDELTR